MSLLAKTVTMLVPLLLTPPVFAEQKKADDFYQQGIEYLRDDQFSLALDSFSQAEKVGLKSASLYYNRGVALYQLGKYPAAKEAFTQALNGANDVALTHYNLGFVEMRLGNTSAAMMAFSNAASSTTNKKLARLSNEMIARLNNDFQAQSSAAKNIPFTLLADGMLGYDDNVTLENTELAQGSSLTDMYYDLYASVKYQLAGDRKDGYWVRAGASTIQYQDYSQYNFTQYSASFYKDKKYADVGTRIGFKYAHIYVGGNDYLEKFTARLQASYALNKQQKLRVRYELAVYDELDSQYSHLAGTRSKIRLDSTWRKKGKRIRLGYELEFNDRNDLALGNNFASYSATRRKVYGDFTLTMNKTVKARLSVDYRQSRYNDANVVAGVVGPTRKDDRFRLQVVGEYSLNRDVDLVLEYRFSDNDSNMINRQYQRNQFLLGVQSYF